MPKKRIRNKKTIPLNTKSLGNDIAAYPFVEIHWMDIEGDAGWSDTKEKFMHNLLTKHAISHSFSINLDNI